MGDFLCPINDDEWKERKRWDVEEIDISVDFEFNLGKQI